MINIEEYILEKFPDANPNHSGKIHTTCPFHDDTTSSFSINVEDGLFICGSTSCGVRGTFPLFYKLMEGYTSWKEVFENLKETSTDYDLDDLLNGKKSTRSKNTTVNPMPDSSSLEPLGEVKYLVDRGLGASTIQSFGLQYGTFGEYEGINIYQTIVAPVWDIDGRYRTFQLRCLNPKSIARWKNPLNGPIQDLLYGGWIVTEGGYLWIVEGASDTWKLQSLGGQAVGLNTKEASPGQMKRILTLCRLYHKIPLVCMDSDASESGEKLFYEISALGLNPQLINLEEGDPGELSIEKYTEILEGIK